MAHAPGIPKTPGSGRKKGTPNKMTVQTREALWHAITHLETQGIEGNPFMVLLTTMVSTTDEHIRVQCAAILADRLLPKLKAVDMSTHIDNLQQALALLRTLPDAALAQMEHPDGQPPFLPHETE
jgi:hypothetical protein